MLITASAVLRSEIQNYYNKILYKLQLKFNRIKPQQVNIDNMKEEKLDKMRNL